MSKPPSPSKRSDYGMDAPPFFCVSLFGGLASVGLATIAWFWLARQALLVAVTLLSVGVTLGAALLYRAFMLLWSWKIGKLRDRDRLLDTISWRGDELVLDAGCGRGLLLIGAAKRLKTGRAFGVDIWRREDLSGNRPEAPLENARREGVLDRVEVKNADLRHLPFPDDYFDVIVSRFAVHNIRDQGGRESALREMARTLKPGGQLALLDIFHSEEYIETLHSTGVIEIGRAATRFSASPPAFLVQGTKRHRGEQNLE